MDHDDDIDDDSPPSEFRRLPPAPAIEAKADRKSPLRSNTGVKGPQSQEDSDAGTMEIINKYGLGDEFKASKQGGRYHDFQSDEREEMEDVKGARKGHVEIRNGRDNRVVKAAPYGRNREEDEDSRESSHWRNSMMENSKRMDESSEAAGEKDEITRDYEDMKKQVDDNDDDN